MDQDVPVFGARSEALPNKTRSCAYVVVASADGFVAATRESGRLFLPGGGQEFPETAVEALHREVREELGCNVILGERVGQALKYFETEDTCQALYATFYAAELGERRTDLFFRPAELAGHRNGGERVLHIVPARHRDLEADPALLVVFAA